MNKLFATPLLPLLLTGCANIYDIGKEGDFFDNNGIPFYIKKGKNTQVTVRERIWLDVTITRVDLDKTRKPIEGSTPDQKTIHIVRSSYDSSALNGLLAKHSAPVGGKSPSFTDVIEKVEKELMSCTSDSFKNGKPKKKNLIISEIDLFEQVSFKNKDTYCLQENVVSNKQEYKEYVDYSTPYYYNANMPWFGSSEATIELNDSGTLKTSTAKADNSKTAEALPLREYLAKRWGVLDAMLALKKKAKEEPTELYTVSEAIKVHSYTLNKVLGKNDKLGDPIKFLDKNIEVITASFGAKAPEKPKEEEKNKIKFDGAIVLPD